MFYVHYLVFLLLLLNKLNVKSANNVTNFLTSSYAKVSRTGLSNTLNEGRSNAGQALWTQRTDAHVVRGQKLIIPKRNNNVSHLAKKDYGIRSGEIIGRGEVIQERFNARPWISYEATANKGPAYLPPTKPNDQPQSNYVYSVPFNLPSLDSDKPPSGLKLPFKSTDKPLSEEMLSNVPMNTYGSPYNSYHPASQEKPDTYTPKDIGNFVTPSHDYLPPETDKPTVEMDKPEVLDTDNLPMEMDHPPKQHLPDTSPPIIQAFDHPQYDDNTNDHKNHYQYDLNSYMDENQEDHKVPSSLSDTENPSPTKDVYFGHLPAYLDHDPHSHGHQFDHYYPYDHHPPIYHEIKTTTPAAEDERLNKKPFSYYYLGRKLWYIPLYFSVYFIIYIFVLILKSIARHKITFNHYFEEDKREMKDTQEEEMHQLEEHVRRDIKSAKIKYMM